jgi:hypothetical protein
MKASEKFIKEHDYVSKNYPPEKSSTQLSILCAKMLGYIIAIENVMETMNVTMNVEHIPVQENPYLTDEQVDHLERVAGQKTGAGREEARDELQNPGNSTDKPLTQGE